MPLPTIAQGAPFVYTVPSDNNGVYTPIPETADSIVLLSSASYGVGNQNSPDQIFTDVKGVFIYVNITAIGTGTVTLHIQGKDQNSGTYFDIMIEPTALAANGFFVYELYPGITPIASPGTAGAVRMAQSSVLPRTWKAVAVVATAAVTFAMTASVMP